MHKPTGGVVDRAEGSRPPAPDDHGSPIIISRIARLERVGGSSAYLSAYLRRHCRRRITPTCRVKAAHCNRADKRPPARRFHINQNNDAGNPANKYRDVESLNVVGFKLLVQIIRDSTRVKTLDAHNRNDWNPNRREAQIEILELRTGLRKVNIIIEKAITGDKRTRRVPVESGAAREWMKSQCRRGGGVKWGVGGRAIPPISHSGTLAA
ncbi:hypothetical protein EVAR_22588_1 [Eumeta japonica]|uniref:Uncharacterized protein n=1 Tax=Eumeta variegata TaxID=151549 RepID=A0A4C1U7F4_EUMVA|nr:hypothetical protein EVAR_22588_1 [Eumeta japonica]